MDFITNIWNSLLNGPIVRSQFFCENMLFKIGYDKIFMKKIVMTQCLHIVNIVSFAI